MESKVIDEWRGLQKNLLQSEIIAEMHRRGLSVINAVKIIRTMYSISLGEANSAVLLHPDWSAEAAINIPLQEAFWRVWGDAATLDSPMVLDDDLEKENEGS